MSTLGERLREARERAGFETAALAAERVGVPYNTYAQHENGTRGFRADKANLYARAFGVDPLWLLYGKGAISSGGLDEPGFHVPKYLPVRYRVQAGHWFEVGLEEQVEQVTLGVLPDPRYDRWPQWLERVEGDSADKKVPPGHYVRVVDAVEMGYAPKDGDWVIVERRRAGGHIRERTIKQVEINGEGVKLWPRSSNPAFQQPVALDAGAREGEDIEVEIVGKVIGSYNPEF